MTDEEIRLLEKIVNRMEANELTRQEKILFVLGIQSGMSCDNKNIKKQLNRVAEICLAVDASYETIEGIKDFNN